MVKSKRMQRIAQLSETAERVAAQTLLKSQSDLDRCQLQISELKEYRLEYSQALRSGSEVRLNGFQAQELRGFIARVDAAIGALERTLNRTVISRDRDREAWAEHLRRTKALQDVATRESRKEDLRAEAISQREIDDRGSVRKP